VVVGEGVVQTLADCENVGDPV
jgi:hypothetical protein